MNCVHEAWKLIIGFSNLCPLVTLMKQFQLVVEKNTVLKCISERMRRVESE